MNKLLFFISFASTIAFSHESPQNNSALALRINKPSLIQYPLLGMKIGAVSGGFCGFIDSLTNDYVLIFTWISTLSLREILIKYYLKNDPAVKDAYSEEKQQITSMTGDLSSWIAYYIVRNLMR